MVTSMSDYPKVMRHRKDGVIVKFTRRGVGTVIGRGHSGSSEQVVGYHSTSWFMSIFNDYKPEILKTKG